MFKKSRLFEFKKPLILKLILGLQNLDENDLLSIKRSRPSSEYEWKQKSKKLINEHEKALAIGFLYFVQGLKPRQIHYKIKVTPNRLAYVLKWFKEIGVAQLL